MVSIMLYRAGLVVTILCLAVMLAASRAGVLSFVGVAALVAVVLAASSLFVLYHAKTTKQ